MFGLIALCVVALDQAAKYLAVTYLADGPVRLIPGFANLVLAYNRGAAFGSFANFDFGPYLLIALNLMALGVMLFVLFSRHAAPKAMQVYLGMVAGGAVGNLIDRFRIGEVIDFMDLYVGSWHWPVFNVADTGITVGGALLAWSIIRISD
jgi:signal peptidase II